MNKLQWAIVLAWQKGQRAVGRATDISLGRNLGGLAVGGLV